MNTNITNFLNELIELSNQQKVSAFTKIELSAHSIKNFDEQIALKLAKTKTNVMPRKHVGYTIPPTKIGNEGYVIEYLKKEGKIKFYISVVQNYLKKL